MRVRAAVPLLLAAALAHPGRGAAQANITLPVDSIERLLRAVPFEVTDHKGTRFQGDRTDRALLTFADGPTLQVKWAKSAPGGEEFNNEPRYELAAYELQKLFLDEGDLVVPPTVARAMPLDWYRVYEPGISPTFDHTASVLVVLQYWLSNVTPREVWDRRRLESDTAYARNFGNLNVLTYLIRHGDSNVGNVLISQDSTRPRLFSVDNGVAFNSPESNRGTAWRSLRTDRLPRATVERLRKLTRDDVAKALGVVAQFEVREGLMTPVPSTASLNRKQGVRHKGSVIQMGLTDPEIDGVYARLRTLLGNVDAGKIQTF